MKSIFVSYSSKDIKDINSIIAAANKNLFKNIDLWIASEKKSDDSPRIPTGAHWPNEIIDGVKNSDGAILLISKNFLKAEIIRDFELPLIIKKKNENPDYKIYPVLLDDCNYEEVEFLKEKNFSNTPSTNLNSLQGRRYNLEIEKLISDVNRDFEKKSLKEKISRNKKLFFIFTFIGVLFFSFSRFQISLNEESSNQSEVLNRLEINELGVGDCFNLDHYQTSNLVRNTEISYMFDNGNINDGMYTPEKGIELFYGPLINPYINLSNKVDCLDFHSGQIVSKQTIYRTDESRLLFPGGYLGVVIDSYCYVEEGECQGILVSDIIKGSPADKSGIKKGSVIKAVNGLPTFSSAELKLYLSSLSEDMLEEPIVLIIIEDGLIEQRIVVLDKNIVEFDNELSIIDESYNLCSSENWNWIAFTLPLEAQYENSEYSFYAVPLLNEKEIYSSSFTVYCTFYLLNTNLENWDNSSSESIFMNWSGDLIESFQNQFSRINNREVFLGYENFYEIKTFEEITIGDCTLFDSNTIIQKIFDQQIPFYSDCSSYGSTMVILSDLTFSISEENLIIENEEFNNFLFRECRNSYLEYRFNPDIAFAVLSDFYDSSRQIIDKPLFSMNYWKVNGDNLNIKCGFLSKDIRYDSGNPEIVGFKSFDNLLKPEKTSDSLELSFEYCPENYFTGDGYYVGNNFKPYEGERLNTLVLLPKWDVGKYPLESISLQIPRIEDLDRSVQIYPYLKGEDFNIRTYSNIIYEYALGFSIEDHTYLQEYDVGVIPSIIIIDENYEGPLEFIIRAYDTDGASAWASCTTNIVKNPKGEMVKAYGKNSNILRNTFGGSDQYNVELPIDFSELSFPKLTYLNIYGDTDNLYIDFDINDFVPPRTIFIDLLVCEFPNEPDCFRVHEDYTTASFYKQRVHFLSKDVDYLLNTSFDGESWELNESGSTLEFRNIPLSFDPCSKIDYDWSNNSVENPIYNFNFECVNENYDKIAVIFDSISYEVYLDKDTWCTIRYNGFRFPQFKEDQPNNQSITISGCLDSKYFQDVPLNKDGGLLGNRYILNFDFETITSLDLYFGSPFYFINP